MASSTKLGSGMSKPAHSGLPSSISSTNASVHLLDKYNVRRSTPDSEALASSDDEGERHELNQPVHHKPVRRTSWLNDTSQAGVQPRKGSFASSSMSPTTSHPTTPSAESSTWGHLGQSATGAGRGLTNINPSFPWNGGASGIWGNDGRKEAPSRLTEVLPSPTSMGPPGSNGTGFFGDIASNHREQQSNQAIPFSIPLHPTPKAYRSQSYSVGQLESESQGVIAAAGAGAGAGANAYSGRGRGIPHSGLQHRPSRPSMLSEMSNEGGLGKLNEVEDDDDESSGGSSSHGVPVPSTESKIIEQLARENHMLRQQQQLHSSRAIRARPASSTGAGYGYGLQETLPEGSDYAIDELDEINDQHDANRGLPARRMSDAYAGLGQQARIPNYASLENRKIENVKKAFWQSSPGFGGMSDAPSRRHSFADVPTRSVGSSGEPLSAIEGGLNDGLSPRYQQEPTGYSLNDHGEQVLDTGRRASLYGSTLGQIAEDSHLNTRNVPNQFSAASYFGGIAAAPRDTYPSNNYQGQQSYNHYAVGQYGQAPSSHRNMFGTPQPRPNQLLYIVLFKCSRADVFYVQEGTGLSVKPGDLVIVEADRGTDLGTVARADVDWSSAKELKEHYSEEHYKWLMMYSQGAADTADGTGAGLMAASNGLQGSAVGGMGPPSQHGMQEPNPGEMKPKIIKRLAQNHEIQSLRDKEGNEAKAKRVCMQKVKEHGLHMEILDAEFQMDWKKLTFYYFADAYINFNSLVTDLFKVYKTRIWMSAINPASFASPSLGLQAPSGIGPGAVGATRTQPERRTHQIEQQSYANAQPSRDYQAALTPYTQAFGRGNPMAQTAFQPGGTYNYGYAQFSAAPRNAPIAQAYNLPSMDGYTTFSTPTDYQGLTAARYPSPHGATSGHDNGDYGRGSHGLSTPDGSWVSQFQGLSMNSR